MKYNIYDVAEKAGVSIFTVSKVINNSETVREKNKVKVLEAMKELNYNPSAAARSLASGKTGVIGLVIHNLADSFLSSTVGAITDYVESHGYFLALSVMPLNNLKIPYLFQKDRVDGLLLLSPVHETQYVLELQNKNIPFVLMDNQQLTPSVHSIVIDNFKGGYDATKYLIELGHKKILHIGGPEIYLASKERENGYKKAMLDANLETHIIKNNLFSIESGYRITKDLISKNIMPTAIFAADDHIAIGVLDALKESSFKVPQDVSIVGYDDQNFSATSHPSLTTIRQPAEEMGKKGAEALLKIVKEGFQKFDTIKLSPKLIVRQSSDVPRIE